MQICIREVVISLRTIIPTKAFEKLTIRMCADQYTVKQPINMNPWTLNFVSQNKATKSKKRMAIKNYKIKHVQYDMGHHMVHEFLPISV